MLDIRMDVIVHKDRGTTKVTLVREPKDEKEAIEMFFNPCKRFKTLMETNDDTLAVRYAVSQLRTTNKK